MDYLIHHRRLGVAVCRRCGHAVFPEQMESHFAGDKYRLNIAQRNDIRAAIRPWNLKPESRIEEAIDLFDTLEEPLSGLPVWSDGFKCTMNVAENDADEYSYICRTDRGIKKHCRREYRWNNTWKKDRVGKARAAER